MKVLIAGACEHSGHCLVEYLSKNTDHEPYVVIHEDEKEIAMEYMDENKITVIDSIHVDLNELDHLMRRMDAVIFAGGCDVRTNDRQLNAKVLNDTKQLINAAGNNYVKRFILLSAMGADDPQGELEDYLYKKREAEDYLKNTALDYTIIRAGELEHREPTGKVKLEGEIHWMKDSSLSCADAAKIMAAALDTDRLLNKTIEVVSGETDVDEAIKNL